MAEGPGPDHSFRDPRALQGQTQSVLNEAWPFHDQGQRHARGLDDKPIEDQLNVIVRVEFERDGETYLQGRAIRWTDNFTHACIVVNDPRLTSPYLWVRARDAQPRT